MSNVYASGSQATATAAIISQLNSLISYTASGAKSLDVASMVAWLRTEFATIATTDGAPTASQAQIQRAADMTDVGALIADLAQVISADHWRNRADWPAQADRSADSKVASLRAEQAALATVTQQLQQQYTDTRQAIVDNLPVAYDGFVAPLLDKIVVRENEDRVYIVTYVTDRGEESAPSPASDLVEVDQNDTVSITIGAPSVASPYGPLSKWRIYRSATNGVNAAWQFLAEVSIGTLTYTDSKKVEELGELCQTLTWIEPPVDLTCLSGGPNGIMAGASGKTLCFCVPFAHYAWPDEFKIPLEHEIVAIGMFGQTWVVATKGKPYFVSGADSASMSALKIDSSQACVSKRALKSAEGGVLYPSSDGLCLADSSGVRVISEAAYSKEDWLALNPANSFAAVSEGVYYFFLGG